MWKLEVNVKKPTSIARFLALSSFYWTLFFVGARLGDGTFVKLYNAGGWQPVFARVFNMAQVALVLALIHLAWRVFKYRRSFPKARTQG